MRTGYRGAASSSSMNSVSMSRSVVAPAQHNHNFLDDSSQLDDILKELMGDQHDPTPSTMTRLKGTTQNEGSITTHSGNSRTVVSWQTSQSGPQRSVTSSTYSMQRPIADSTLVAKEPFSYGVGAHSTGAHSTSTYEETRQSTTSSVQRPTTPSRFTAHSSNGGYQNFEYLTEGEQSWLQEQQQKLQSMKDHRDMPRRTEQERKLVAELKSAQSTLTRRRAESEAEEDAVVQQYTRKDRNVFAPNGPATYAVMTPSPTSPPQIVDHTERSEKNYFVSGIERPPFTTHQTKYTFSVSPPQSGTARPGNKPPVGRVSAPGSPVVPVRGSSSQEAVVRTRTVSARDYQMNGNDPFTPSTSAVTTPVMSSQIFSEQTTTTTPCVEAPQVCAELQAPLPKPPAIEEPIVKAVASRKSEGNSIVEVS